MLIAVYQYDEMDIDWSPMYKAQSVDAPRYEVVKLQPACYGVYLIRPDTGDAGYICAFDKLSVADVYCKYKNRRLRNEDL